MNDPNDNEPVDDPIGDPIEEPRVEEVLFPDDAEPMRLDTFLARRQDVVSRTHFQQLIQDGRVEVNGEPAKKAQMLEGGERIVVRFPPAEETWPAPQDLPLDIVHQDDDVVVINKAAGMIVHPAAGNPDGTMVNALLWHVRDLPGINGTRRPGIVHRLDRETTGAIVVAKNDKAMASLSRQLQARSVKRLYLALVLGSPEWDETTVDAPIGRHPTVRVRRCVDGEGAKRAVTHLRVFYRHHNMALLRCELETGRTHQIRVHCSHIGHPIVGDADYDGAAARAIERLRHEPSPIRAVFGAFQRPALHARLLAFHHPSTGTRVAFRAALPDDLARLLRLFAPDTEPEQFLATDDSVPTPHAGATP